MELDRIDDDAYHTEREYVFLRRVSARLSGAMRDCSRWLRTELA